LYKPAVRISVVCAVRQLYRDHSRYLPSDNRHNLSPKYRQHRRRTGDGGTFAASYTLAPPGASPGPPEPRRTIHAFRLRYLALPGRGGANGRERHSPPALRLCPRWTADLWFLLPNWRPSRYSPRWTLFRRCRVSLPTCRAPVPAPAPFFSTSLHAPPPFDCVRASPHCTVRWRACALPALHAPAVTCVLLALCAALRGSTAPRVPLYLLVERRRAQTLRPSWDKHGISHGRYVDNTLPSPHTTAGT